MKLAAVVIPVVLPVALLAGPLAGIPVAGALAALPPEWAAVMERLLHNPRERTAKALEAAGEERPLEAVPYARQARELAPEDPRTHYNAGTLELTAGLHEEAATSLERAVAGLSTEGQGGGGQPGQDGRAPLDPIPTDGPGRPATERFHSPELATAALYNLGNARFAGGDLQGAVEAYQETLRLDPDHQDAKYNLELALREHQRRNPPPDASQNQEEREGEGEEESRDSPPSDQQGEQEQQQQQQEGEGEQEPQPRDPPRDSSLEDFQNQPDMTAEEAAAILQAVQNLERQQRREEAAERARRSRRGEKDW